jgi:hypothetical protein
MYPLGTVLRMKTTGESVCIIGDALDENKVVVRRPTNTQADGVRHFNEEFFLCELDTVEESIRREFNEVKIRQALIKGEEFRAELVQ